MPSADKRRSERRGGGGGGRRRQRVRPFSPSKLAGLLRGDYDEKDGDRLPVMTVEYLREDGDDDAAREGRAREELPAVRSCSPPRPKGAAPPRRESLRPSDDEFSDNSSDATEGGCCGLGAEEEGSVLTGGGDSDGDGVVFGRRAKRAASFSGLVLAALATANLGGGFRGPTWWPSHRHGPLSRSDAVYGTTEGKGGMGSKRSMNVLVTGGAGFIGMHTALRLRDLGHNPVAYDNLSPALYSPAIKSARVHQLSAHSVPFVRGDVCDADALNRTLTSRSIDAVVHLASQSYERSDGRVKRPFRYPHNNLDCFATLLDQLRARASTGSGDGGGAIKLIYSSSSSGYRLNLTVPHSPHTAHPTISLAGVAKDEVLDPDPKHADALRSDEMIARAYYRLYGISSVGVRFGTVYGPWGRPDMSYYAMATWMSKKGGRGNEVRVHYQEAQADNETEAKKVKRSFLYVDDAVSGLLSVLTVPNDGADVVTMRRPCAMRDATVLGLLEQQMSNKDGVGMDAAPPSVPLLRQSERSKLHDDGSSGGGGGWKDEEEQRCAQRGGLTGVSDQVLLEEGMQRFVRWFREEDGAQYAPLLATPNTESLEMKQGALITGVSAVAELNAVASKLCFITAMFSDDPAMQSKEVFSVEEYDHAHPFEYYYFTNVRGLEAPGWEVVLIEDLPYKRFITQSRFPKFMGWSHPKLSSCRTIYYSDSNRPPKSLPLANWTALSVAAAAAKSGVLQDVRPGHEPLLDELASLIPRQKDIERNVETSREWFLSQPDFNNNATAWWNMASVIDPSNQRYRELTTTFWAHYSAEEGSWRDQPLWRYVVDKLGIVPSGFPGMSRGHDVYWGKIKGSGRSHHYDEGDDEKRSPADGGVVMNEAKP